MTRKTTERRHKRGEHTGTEHLVPRMPAQEIDDARLEDRDSQPAQDLIDEALMESFPCSDPPCFIASHI